MQLVAVAFWVQLLLLTLRLLLLLLFVALLRERLSCTLAIGTLADGARCVSEEDIFRRKTRTKTEREQERRCGGGTGVETSTKYGACRSDRGLVDGADSRWVGRWWVLQDRALDRSEGGQNCRMVLIRKEFECRRAGSATVRLEATAMPVRSFTAAWPR